MENTAVATENVAELKSRIAELEVLVKYYEEQFRLSKHQQFGASSEKSEYDFGQLTIFNEAELFADANIPELELIEVEKHYRKRTRLTTDKLPDDLPIEVVEQCNQRPGRWPDGERTQSVYHHEAVRGQLTE